MKRTILITGGTGLVGKALTEQLVARKYHVIILTRSLKDHKNTENISYALWNVEKESIDISAVCKADGIIHLAGAGVVDKKWTDAYKKEIIDSRTKSIRLIIDTIKNSICNAKVIVSASATGWYGPDKVPGHSFKENEPPANDFLGEVCRLWEESSEPAESMGIRVCRLRTGIVLSREGGAYAEFKKPVKFGVAAILGSGKQVVSWIHIDDLCRAYIHALENEMMIGSYNAVTTNPVTNKELTLTIADNVRGKFYLPIHVPAFVLKIMMGGRSIEILKSATVSAEKIIQSGFTFLYPDVESAVKQIEQKN